MTDLLTDAVAELRRRIEEKVKLLEVNPEMAEVITLHRASTASKTSFTGRAPASRSFSIRRATRRRPPRRRPFQRLPFDSTSSTGWQTSPQRRPT